MKNKIIIIFIIFFLYAGNIFAGSVPDPIERILYSISPLGSSEYQNFGIVEFRGKRASLVVFKTSVMTFADTEKIYSDPETGLPIFVERNVSFLFRKEYLTEEYSVRENKVVITKMEGGKKVKEYILRAKGGPIHNAVLLPFSLRRVPELVIGWSMRIRLPQEFKVQLVSIEDIGVPVGKFTTYHFTSDPPKFEIWISKDNLRLPVKIKGMEGFSYTLAMQKRVTKGKDQAGKK